MLLSIVIILILLSAIFRGYRRGFVLELLYTIGYIVVFIFARFYTTPLSTFLTNTFGGWTKNALENLTIMHSLSFIILMSFGWIIVRAIGRASKMITWLPIIKQVNGLAGGAVAFIISYAVVFIILSVSQFIPNNFYQTQLSESPIAQGIISKTPGISSQILNDYILHTDQTKKAL